MLSRALDYKTLPAKLHPGNAKASARSSPRTCRAGLPASGPPPAAAGARSGQTTSRRRSTSPRRWPPGTSTSWRARWPARSRWTPPARPPGSPTWTKEDRPGRLSTSRPVGGRPAAELWQRPSGSCSTRSPAQRSPTALPTRATSSSKYIMVTVGYRRLQEASHLHLLEDLPPHNEDGAGGDHVYAPWWLYEERPTKLASFLRSYHVEFTTGKRDAPRPTSFA